MGDQYGFADLRQMISAAPRFPVEDHQDHHHHFHHAHREHLTQVHQHQHYEMLMMGNDDHHLHQVAAATSEGLMAPPLPPPPPPHRSGSNSCGLIDVFCSSSSAHHDSTHANNSTPTAHDNNAGANTTTSFCGSGAGRGSLEILEAGAGHGVGGGNFMMSTSAGGGDGNGAGSGGGGGNSRWPRQETLTLLEIRSRLDSKFKEANQKGPLWDEVSRIMGEEHGYQRSGKKCREKFENLYKYYKKTKEGKAGRQDGKHYRFFRQLEALYGTHHDHETATTSTNPLLLVNSSLSELAHVGALGVNVNGDHDPQFHQSTIANHHHIHQQAGYVLMQPAAAQSSRLSESLSFSNSSEFDTSSSEDDDIHIDDHLTGVGNFKENDDDSIMDKLKRKSLKDDDDGDNRRSTNKSRGARKSWKAKIKDFVDSRMKKLMETQEAWLERMLKTLEHKEQERMTREEEWRKQESARIDREHKYWRAQERAWFEARDATLMNALQRFIGRRTDLKMDSPLHEEFMAAAEHHENYSTDQNHNENGSSTVKSTSARWSEEEISSLLKLRSSLDSRFQQMMSGSCSQGALWEEIAAILGYHRSARSCQEKWESIINNNDDEFSYNNNKKRRENISSRAAGPYSQLLIGTAYDHHHHGEAGFVAAVDGTMEDQGPEVVRIQLNDGPSPSNSNAGTSGNNDNSCFRFLMNGGENNLWENTYGMNKLEKGGN